MKRTSISVGIAVNDLLVSNKELLKKVKKIFPVVTDSAELPYVAYRRIKAEQVSVKGYRTGAEAVQVQVNCYSASYVDGIEIAEMVRSTLDGATYSADGINISSIVMTNTLETWENDAYVQELIFELRC